jgi:hypothetical protein
MSRARDFADLAGSADAGGLTGRNLIINGAMQVAQRGTSQTGVTSGGYKDAPDRFKIEADSAGTWTLSQSTTAPDGFSYSYKFDCTTANTSLSAGSKLSISQRIEGQDLQHLKKGTSGAESITLSFWVRSAKTGTYIVQLKDQDNTRTYSQAYTISSANTWEHKTLTYAGDTTGAFDNDNADSFRIFWWLVAGTDYTSGTLATAWQAHDHPDRAVGQVNLADSTSNEWYITGTQLEVGETATPFEHRSFGDELLRCQRYFAKIRAGWSGDTTNDGSYRASYQNAVEMRATPTATWTNISQAGFDAAHNSEQITTYGGGVYRQCNTTSDGRLYWSDATLDAEL